MEKIYFMLDTHTRPPTIQKNSILIISHRFTRSGLVKFMSLDTELRCFMLDVARPTKNLIILKKLLTERKQLME